MVRQPLHCRPCRMAGGSVLLELNIAVWAQSRQNREKMVCQDALVLLRIDLAVDDMQVTSAVSPNAAPHHDAGGMLDGPFEAIRVKGLVLRADYPPEGIAWYHFEPRLIAEDHR